MTIASALENLNTDIINARTAITTKGGTVTANGGSSQLAADIATIPTGGGSATLITKSITANGTYNASSDNADGYSSVNVNVPTGITPTGTRTITANGTYDVTNYASADVNVSGGASSKYGATVDSFLGDVDANGVLQQPSTPTNLVFTGVEDVSNYCLQYKFNMNPSIKSVSFPDLTGLSGSIAMSYAFSSCTGITSVDLSSLTTVSGSIAMSYAFSSCTGITSVDLSSLTTVSGLNAMSYAFSSCTGITSVDLSSLTTVSGGSTLEHCFDGCTGLTSIDLSSLTTVSGSSAMRACFQGCRGLTSIDLSSLTTVSGNNAMYVAFASCINLSSVLFTNLETIGSNTTSGSYQEFAYCFNSDTSLESLTFPKLKEIYCTSNSSSYGTFTGNKQIQKFYFPKLDTITYGTGASTTNQTACKNIFSGCSALTELHFGAANQAAIEASPGYSTAWGRGAGNVTIYFDL